MIDGNLILTKLLNNGNIYVVVRNHFEYSEYHASAVCGVCKSLERADEFKGVCEQQWLDRVGNLDGVEFDIQLSVLYD